MNWINYTTLIVSVGTLIYLIINSIISNNNKKKDRKILVTLEEKREMRNALFYHITSILDLGRKCYEVTDISEKQKMKIELLNHKVFIWINLNRGNIFSKDLRSRCNMYITWCSSGLEKIDEKDKESYLFAADRNLQHIWQLIDKYIEEENSLTNELI